MKGPILTLAMATTVAVLALPNQAAAQVPPPAKRAKRVRIIEAPRPELVVGGYLTIIRWTTNNPGGTDDHFGVVYYGTDSKNLDQTAKSPTRLNQAHPTTTFRVRLDQLEPQTTYYFRVDCEDATGRSDGVNSPIGKFITPAAGQRIPASPRGARG